MQQLTSGTLLQGGKYKIVRFISAGGFGNTYEGVHTMMDTKVAIKEFFPKMFCNRDENTSHITVATQSNRELVDKLRKKFVEEAKSIFKMNHPNIVKVHDIFEENGSAYYVMDFIDGKSLGDMVKAHGILSENEAVGYIRQVADALKYVHSLNRLHLDIKPGNIMVDKNGNAMLIDFGASKHYDMESGENTSTLMGVNTKGYAPVEQSTQSFTKFSPATDIYALGATLYKLLTGITSPDANLLLAGEETLQQLPSNISVSTRNAVSAAMSLRRADRPQSIDDFLTILNVQASANADDEETVLEETEDTIIKEEGKQNIENTQKTARIVECKQTETALQVTKEDEIQKSEEFCNVNEKSGKWKLWVSIAAMCIVVVVIIGLCNNENLLIQEQSTETYSVNGVSFEMCYVKGGTFRMGCNDNDAYDYEKTLHNVTLSDYWIGQTEVTQGLWKAVMGSNPSSRKGDNLPVVQVSWNDCQEFINKLNNATGKKFRLPTEAEWEFAARGGNNSKEYRYSGSNTIDDVAWHWQNSGKIYLNEYWNANRVVENNCKTHPVATKLANELGIYDMSGNVWEWCSDWFGDYTNNAQANPKGPKNGSERVLRGGDCVLNNDFCRTSRRFYDVSAHRSTTCGLRLVINP